MNNTILVAGATGNLGRKIVDALVQKGADVRVVVRLESDQEKIKLLKKMGVTVFQVDMTNQSEIAKACKGVSCVISALPNILNLVPHTIYS